MTSAQAEGFAAFVAIDWADQKHTWKLQVADSGEVELGKLENTPEAVEVWAVGLGQRFEGRKIAVALEQSRGAVVNMLTKYAHVVLFPVHPGTLCNYRKALCPSGAKDDPRDTDLLLDLLVKHRSRLRAWEPDTVGVRTLQFLVEDRRHLVHEKTRHSNRLTARLKLYFPQVLTWFDDIDSVLVGELLKRWPTLEELQKARPDTLRDFFHQHNCRSAERIQQRLEQIGKAIPATRDAAVIDSNVRQVRILIGLLTILRQAIAELDREIAARYAIEPDAPLFESLPGAGPALSPRLLVAMGTRRDRYETAAEVQCYSGIAPVLEGSGKREWTHRRLGCPKFLRQTFHEWAAQTISRSQWARTCYQRQRDKGQGHHAAVRYLAFKWIRVLYRCWKDRVPYDEARYQEALLRRSCPAKSQEAVKLDVQWSTEGGFSRFAGGSLAS